MTKLSVNLNAVAYLRNRRQHVATHHLHYPNLEQIAKIAIKAGADGITIHPRPDQRHITKRDIPILHSLYKVYNKNTEFNIEGFPSSDFLDLIEQYTPSQVTLVPDSPNQTTSDHGWTPNFKTSLLKQAINRIKKSGARVSVFVEPDEEHIQFLADCGTDRVELYSGPFAEASDPISMQNICLQMSEVAQFANSINIEVNAGHDLNLHNLNLLIKIIPSLKEVSIGHAIFSDAIIMGLEKTIKAYNKILKN